MSRFGPPPVLTDFTPPSHLDALLLLLPPVVAALRKSIADAAAARGRVPLLFAAQAPGAVVKSDDFKAFLVNADGELSSGSRREGSTQKTKATRQNTISKQLNRRITAILSSSSKVAPSTSFISSGNPTGSSHSSLGTFPDPRQRLPFYCEAFAYIHETPAEVGRAALDVASLFFILRAGRKSRIVSARGEQGGHTEQPQQQQQHQEDAAVLRRPGYRSDNVHELDPLLLAQIGERLYVVMYKQVQAGSKTMIELLHNLVLVEGPGGEVVIYFTPLDEETMAKTSLEAANTLHERRKAVMAKGYSIVEGKETGCLVLTPDAVGLTQTHMVFSAEYDIDLEEKSGLKLLGEIFSPLLAAQQMYERCDWVDKLKMKRFVSVTMPSTPAATDDELAAIDGALKYNVDDGCFQRVRGSLKKYPTVHMFVRQSTNRSLWGKCYGDVDGAIDEVFAWIWLVCSYERMQTHRAKNGSLVRKTDSSEDSRSQSVAAEYIVAPNLANRWSETKCTWVKPMLGEIFVAFDPTMRGGAELFTRGAVEAKSTGLYHFKEVAPQITQMTLVQTVDLGGSVPEWIMQMLVTSAFSLLLRAQERFGRPDRIVDKEMRETIATKIRCSAAEVTPDAKDILYSCSKLKEVFEKKDTLHLVEPLEAPSPFVQYSMYPAHQENEGKIGEKKGLSGRRVATGKAVAEVDTSMEAVVAWIFDYCSRERIRINIERNRSLPRIIVRKNAGSRSQVAGSVKNAPYPLYYREFVVDMTWIKTSANQVVVCVRSTNEKVDYGWNKTTVRGTTTIFYEIEVAREIVSLTQYQQIDFGGFIPVSLANKKIPSAALIVTSELREAFKRDEEVDLLIRRTTVANLNGGQLDDEEQALCISVAGSLSRGSDSVRNAVDGSLDHFVKVFRLSHSVGSSTSSAPLRPSLIAHAVSSIVQNEKIVFETEVVVDTDIKECVAWMLSKCSRQRTQSFFDQDGGASRSEEILSRRRRATTDVYLEKQKLGGLLTERREVLESVWDSSEDGSKYVVVEKNKRAGSKVTKLVCSESETTFGVSEELAGSTPQTTIRMKFALACGAGSFHEELTLSAGTRRLSELRKSFDKSVEIDRRRREMFCESLKVSKEVYADREIEILAEGMNMLSHFEGKSAKAIKMIPPTTKAKVAYTAGDSRAWGWASGLVRADAVDVLAHLQDVLRRAGMRQDDVEKAIVETANNHNVLVYNWKKTPKIISDRDFLSLAIWRAVGSAKFEFVTVPEESADCPIRPGVVRARYPSAWSVEGVEGKEALTRVEYVIHPDFGGSVPATLFNLYIKKNLERVTEVQEYFQRLRPLSVYDERDGAAVGETFMIKTNKERQKNKGASKYQVRVASVVQSHVAIREFSALHPWFPSLVEGMLSRRLRGAKNIRTKKLENLSNREALTIGRSFSAQLRARKSAQVGSAVWIDEYPALGVLAMREKFFVPMAQTIGQRKIEQAPWGLHWTVALGAVLSILDVATDAYAIANFTLQGNRGYARAVISGVSVSMAIQLLIVYGNGKKRGKRHLLKEAMIVLSGFKPAVDAFRVIGGVKAHKDDTVAPIFELILCKVVEIVAESIPSSLVQIYALLTSPPGSVSAASIASIVISVATISLGSSNICFDFDLDPERRMHDPDFYGYVPNSSGKRTIVFYLMFFFTACHVALRLIGIALLAAVSPLITVVVFGGDMVFFLLFKLARSDFRYWLRLPGALSWIVSFLVRLLTKLMVDFTVMVQLRHPQEIGGVYWCVCLLLGQATSFVAVYLYYSASEGALENGATAINLWGLIGSLEAAFVVFFAIFIALIDRKYGRTFFSFSTAKQFRIKSFREAKTDQMKVSIFKLHPTYYASSRGEVKEWLRERWDIWSEERPEWFTKRVKASVPKDMIPVNEEISK